MSDALAVPSGADLVLLQERLTRLEETHGALQQRCDEAEQALEAIRTGQIESLVIDGPDGVRIFSLEGAAHSYRVLVEAMNEGAATLGEDGAVLYCNACLARLLGLPLQRAIGSHLLDRVPERFHPAVRDLLQRAREKDVREEMALLAEGGQEIPVYLSASTMMEGERLLICLIVTDLREQKKSEQLAAAEKATREAEDRLRQALRAANAGSWEMDPATQEMVWSPENFALFGIAPPTPTYAKWTSLIDRGDLKCLEAAYGDAVEGRATECRAEYRIAHSTLGERWMLSLGQVRRDSHGKPVRLVGLNLDITELKQAELRLREEDRNKNQFIAMLSHELRNPLSPIQNSLYVLDHATPGGEQALRARAVIKRQVSHMTRLIEDLLDVTRISRGKLRLQREPVDLAEIVRRTAEDFRPGFDQAEITFEVSLWAGPLPMQGDRTRLAQAIGNLLHNASKFTPRGGRVTLAVEPDGAAARAVVRVTDDGAGIPDDLLPRLFEPFSQADNSLDRTRGGLGLGLSLVKGMVELHGGSVQAASGGPGRGAQFTLCLPLEGHAVEALGEAAPAPRLQVLVVEDNRDSADSLADLLRMSGHGVRVAYDGAQALSLAGELRPDVVLCDLGLPVMDGHAVARALRSQPASRDVVLVALTGYAMAEELERARESGFDHHLAKPPDIPELERLLERAARKA